MCKARLLFAWLGAVLVYAPTQGPAAEPAGPAPPAVIVTEGAAAFTLANGFIAARIDKATGNLVSLKYNPAGPGTGEGRASLELLAQGRGGATGGYWSSVGRGRPISRGRAVIRIDPRTNSGERAEVSCELHNLSQDASSPVDVDYRYALGRGEQWLYVYALLEHKPGYPAFSVGEARYCVKLSPEVFDYMSIDTNRQRLMPSGYDWDHGAPLNLKEARRMTTGVHKGEAEHKYDYSAVLSETPAYGWSSTRHHVGLWLINPSMEYLGGGPTKAELTGHLDVNPGGLPTLLNMWVGSHYGGTSLAVGADESWTKVVGPFLLYCNSDSAVSNPAASALSAQERLWRDALARAASESALWPCSWLAEPHYPGACERGGVSGQIVLRDPGASNSNLSNLWVGVTAPDYAPPRSGFSFRGFGGFGTNATSRPSRMTNFPGRGFGLGRGGFPPYVDWQRDAKFYQFWTRADAAGRFAIAKVRPGTYTLHAFAENVLGEFSLTNVTVAASHTNLIGRLEWTPLRFGRTLWEIGVSDRSAREFRHGDHYWQWGLYFEYPRDFPEDVSFVVGKSDWRQDWNYVQPPRLLSRDVPMTGEDDEQREEAPRGQVRSTSWRVLFNVPEGARGRATLRLAFCGTHAGCNVEAFINERSIGDTGTLPSTSAMQRDGIRAYWLEKNLGFDAALLRNGTNVLRLLSHANSWSQGVMYDYLRLELDEGNVPAE